MRAFPAPLAAFQRPIPSPTAEASSHFVSKRKSKKGAPQPPAKPQPAVTSRQIPPVLARRWRLKLGVLLATLCFGGAIFADWWTCLPEDLEPHYVGGHSCVECHQQEAKHWQGSHHDLAMDRATEATVLGDFDDATIEHHGITSRMFRDGERYMVHTEGPDGEMADFEVKYVFGLTPLQQYMVEFERHPKSKDDEVGRVQVLRLSWDTVNKKWFYLAPPDVNEKLPPGDDLHWTGVAQRWNNMCADCHSTNLQKQFDLDEQRYRTTFSEIDVSCESCHGPGSNHVKLASATSLFWDRKQGYGLARLKDKSNTLNEIESCAQCHSRRRLVYPDFRPGDKFDDHFAVELLNELTYHADGQIKDEVYVYGSFIQSKMFHKGIRCTDCHDPHTARLKFEGNKVCTSCHQHPAAKYDAPAHHHHKVGSTGASCVECHMPQTTYMEVDPRRDHSLRVPRPDISVDLNTPNACVRCHVNDEGKPSGEKFAKLKRYQDWLLASETDVDVKEYLKRKNVWAAEAVTQWYGEKQRPEHFAYALDLARKGDPAATEKLLAVFRNRTLPAIVRATAVSELGQFAVSNEQALAASLTGLKDPNPLVRAAAVANLQILPAEQLIEQASPMLKDGSRTVRSEAARVLAMAPQAQMYGSQRALHKQAIADFKQGLMLNNDRAAAHMNLGILYDNMRRVEAAKKAYRQAIELEPGFTGPRTNLASMIDRELTELRQRMQQLTIQRQKDEALKLVEEAATLQAELDQLRVEELQLLRRDAELAPTSGPIHYRLGFLNYLLGEREAAEQALRKAVELEPNNADFVLALLLFYQKFERHREALAAAERLIELQPNDQQAAMLLEQARRAATGPQR